uniref:(northern house mosquito) hypothetical protein n=1 Tax=Culex pipiens TaxID=7175 RepID=A0A8D8JVV5_CULPI
MPQGTQTNGLRSVPGDEHPVPVLVLLPARKLQQNHVPRVPPGRDRRRRRRLPLRSRVSVPVLLVRPGEKVPTPAVRGLPAGNDPRLRKRSTVRSGKVLGLPQVLQERPEAGRRSQAQGAPGQVQVDRGLPRAGAADQRNARGRRKPEVFALEATAAQRVGKRRRYRGGRTVRPGWRQAARGTSRRAAGWWALVWRWRIFPALCVRAQEVRLCRQPHRGRDEPPVGKRPPADRFLR